MKFRLVYGICPTFTWFTNKVKEPFAGISYGPFIFIKKQFKTDVALLEHEITHAKQFYRYPIVAPFLYKFWAKWRYKMELEAYKKQLEYTPNNMKVRALNIFANFLATRYGLKIEVEQVKRDLK